MSSSTWFFPRLITFRAQRYPNPTGHNLTSSERLNILPTNIDTSLLSAPRNRFLSKGETGHLGQASNNSLSSPFHPISNLFSVLAYARLWPATNLKPLGSLRRVFSAFLSVLTSGFAQSAPVIMHFASADVQTVGKLCHFSFWVAAIYNDNNCRKRGSRTSQRGASYPTHSLLCMGGGPGGCRESMGSMVTHPQRRHCSLQSAKPRHSLRGGD